MDESDKQELRRIIDDYYSGMVDDLTTGVAAGHVYGGVDAYTTMRIEPDFDLVKSDAVDYMTAHRDDLVQRGGLYCYDYASREDVFRAWLSDQTTETRRKIFDVIDGGLSQGKSTNDIADDLGGVWNEMDDRNETIARTEIMRAHLAGSKTQYKNRGVSRVQWLLGDEACEFCRAIADENDGVYDIDNARDCPTPGVAVISPVIDLGGEEGE